MKKFILAAFLLGALTPMDTRAQKFLLSGGLEIAAPGDGLHSENTVGTGLGPSLRLEGRWGPHISGMITAGYLWFPETVEYTDANTKKMQALQIQLGLKFYIGKARTSPGGFFLAPEWGIMSSNLHFSYYNGDQMKLNEVGILWGMGGGYLLGNVEASMRLQFNLTEAGYHIYYYNFRIAYAFRSRHPAGSATFVP